MNQISINTVINKIQQKWGHQAIQSARNLSQKQEGLLTGFSQLDALIGGIQNRTLTQFTGKLTSGMTTLSYHVMAQAQKQGQHVVFVDMGTSFDGGYIIQCGVNIDDLLLVEAHEEYLILDLLIEIVNSQVVGLLVLNLVSVKSLDLDWRKVLPSIWASQSAIILLSQPQIKQEIAGLRLHIARQHWIEQDLDIVGCLSQVTIERHRYGKVGESVMLCIPFVGG